MFVRWQKSGEVGGRQVLEGQFVQVRNCMWPMEGDKLSAGWNACFPLQCVSRCNCCDTAAF